MTALPLYSVSRGFCKSLLCDTFNVLLLSDSAPSQSVVDRALESFKWILGVAKDLNSYLLSCQEGGDQQLSALAQSLDSGKHATNVCMPYTFSSACVYVDLSKSQFIWVLIQL